MNKELKRIAELAGLNESSSVFSPSIREVSPVNKSTKENCFENEQKINKNRERMVNLWAIYQHVNAACVLFEKAGEGNVAMAPTYKNLKEVSQRIYHRISVIGSGFSSVNDWPINFEEFEKSKPSDFYV